MSNTKSTGRFSLDDYVDVAERIVAFNDKYPDGSLQTICWSVEKIGDQLFIVYRAAAYRTPDDPRPGHGIAWEPFPGTTPYTRNSELMNAETASWGRAIIAVGLPASKKLASKQEVRARQEEQQQPAPEPEPADRIDDASLNALRRIYKEVGWTEEQLRLNLVAVGVADVSNLGRAMAGLSQKQAGQLLHAMNVALDLVVAKS